MHVENNKSIALRYIEEMHNKRNLDVADELFSDECKIHLGQASFNREDYKNIILRSSSTFSDITTTVDDLIAEGDKVVTRWTSRFIHQDKFMGVDPTYQQIKISGISIYRVNEGKIAEIWISWDRLSLMQQLGIIHP